MKEVYKDDAGRYIEGKYNQRYYEQSCERCGDAYFPRRRGAQKYCSQSCNVRACRERNGYETLDGVKVSKGKAAMLGQMEAIEKKLDALGGKTMGVNTEMVKSTIAGNAIYDVGKAVAKSLFGPEDDVKEIKKRLAGIEARLANLQPSPPQLQQQTQNRPQMLSTGKTSTISDGKEMLRLEEFTNGKDRVFKVIDQKPLQAKTPRKTNYLDM
jgi:hypothetical protein